MRLSGSPRLYPLVVVFGAVGLASVLTLVSPLARNPVIAECQPSSGVSCPTPIPVNAFLSLDVTAGDPNTVINVTGGQFLPNEALTLYWDRTNKVAGSATADASGSFNTRVKPFSGDTPGLHKLCASVPPSPCANFTLQAATPTPSSSPPPTESPAASPSATETPTLSASPARITSNLSGFDVISRPPFVFLPVFGIGALLLSLAYWGFSAMRRPRGLVAIPSAAVVHRATRPDYSAGFATPPPTPSPSPQPSAWNEPIQATPPAQAAGPAPAPPAAAAPEATVEWGPPVEWGAGGGDWGFPEPPPQEETPEPPQTPEAPPPTD